MSRSNWRDAGAYGGTRSLDAPGYAWEFLKRNPLFVRELRLLRRIARRETQPCRAGAVCAPLGGTMFAGLSETANSKSVRWTLSALPTTTILTTCGADFADARFSENYPALASLAPAKGEELLEHHSAPFRVLIDASGKGSPAVVLPLDRLLKSAPEQPSGYGAR